MCRLKMTIGTNRGHHSYPEPICITFSNRTLKSGRLRRHGGPPHHRLTRLFHFKYLV